MNGKSLLGGIAPLYQRIIALFPRDISLCFAYGSAVYPQKQNNVTASTKKNVIDLIFVVPNAYLWHDENIKRNPKHYSALRYFGHRSLARIQESYGAGVYYNTLIPFEDVEFKYGVVSQSSLITDLLDWNYLYLSGRLHKPVLTLLNPVNRKLRNALKLNLHSAIHAALLLLPETFTEEELYCTITGLSYYGDFRMIFGEDKNKVINIVKAQQDLFRELYSPVIKSLNDYVELTQCDGVYMGAQDPSPVARMFHLNQLPRNPQRSIVRHWNKTSSRKNDAEDVLAAVAYDIDTDIAVQKALKEITWSSSVTQSIKGIFTAGIIKSVRYSMAKVRKMLMSKSKKDKIESS
jgi:translocator assembly and maintenance protein 41